MTYPNKIEFDKVKQVAFEKHCSIVCYGLLLELKRFGKITASYQLDLNTNQYERR